MSLQLTDRETDIVKLRIEHGLFERLLRRLERLYPREGCGFLAGRAGLVMADLPVTNVDPHPARFRMDPREQVAALLLLERRGWDVAAVYHSHPKGVPWLSPRDLAQLAFPEAVQLVVALRGENRPVARAFLVQTGRIVPITLTVA